MLKAKINDSHFIPGLLFGGFFVGLIVGFFCWVGPIAVRDNVIADLSETTIKQAKTIDSLNRGEQK